MVKLRWPIRSRFTHRSREFKIKGPGVHDVPEDLVDRYRKRGWVKPEQDPEPVESDPAPDTESESESDQTFTSEAEVEDVEDVTVEDVEADQDQDRGKNKNKSKSKTKRQNEDPAEDTEAFAEDAEEEQRSAGETWSPTREDLESMTHSRLRQLAAESESDEINGNSSSEQIIRVLSRDEESAPEIGDESESEIEE